MNHQLMEKAKENYIAEGYKKLADIEATRKWGKSPQSPLPKYTPAKIMKKKIGWFVILKELTP